MAENSSNDVQIPLALYEAMATCYYGGAPRHRTAPDLSEASSGGTVGGNIGKEPYASDLEQDGPRTATEEDVSKMNRLLADSNPLRKAKPMGYAAKRGGVTAPDVVISDKQEPADAPAAK